MWILLVGLACLASPRNTTYQFRRNLCNLRLVGLFVPEKQPAYLEGMYGISNWWQARNQDFMWGGGGGANEAKVDQTTEMYFLLSDPFI